MNQKVPSVEEKVRASAYGLPSRKESRTTRTTRASRSTTCVVERYIPHADAPGLVPVRRGCFVVRSINTRCPFRLRSKKDRLLGHGFVRTGDSRVSCDRTGYRPERRATGGLTAPARFQAARETPSRAACIARRLVPSILRYLGTGCSDRWLPISRTASYEHLPPQTNVFDGLNSSGSNAICRRQYPKTPARNPGDFWPAHIFSAREIGG